MPSWPGGSGAPRRAVPLLFRAGRRAPRLATAALVLTSLLALPTTLAAPSNGGMAVGVAPALTTAVNATLSVAATNSTTLGVSFWGADVRVYYALGTSQAAAYNASAIRFVRWPGGAVADQYNISANVITNNDGTTYSPPSNIAQFAQWCRWVQCRAIVQLPGEIDQPATAAYYVRYVEQVVRFHPSFWEIGNEPALWKHAGIAWSAWNTSQALNATPSSYAQVVHAYVVAVRTVDSGARFIGLPGVGTGGYSETSWIRATVGLNGANLSAVAIHVYPAGGSSVSPTAASFLGTLAGHGSLAYRAPLDEAAIASACPRCSAIALFVTELGSGTAGGPVDPFMGSFLDVPYLAAEAAQALTSKAANIDLFAFQGSYNGSLLNTSGATTPEFLLYSDVLSHLGPGVRPVTIASAATLLYAASTVSANGTVHSLLFVNANVSRTVHLSLVGSGLPLAGAGSALAWTGATSAPVATTWTLAVPTLWTVPGGSLLLVQVTT